MYISKEIFIKENESLIARLENFAGNELGIFKDGPFNPGVYYDTSPKILWILKEAYGDPLSYPETFTRNYDVFFNDFIMGVPRHTWQPIAIISNSILNGYKDYNEATSIDNMKEEIEESLAKVAFININKESSETGGRSLNGNIEAARKFYQEFLNEQIRLFLPDIVICGNTFQFLRNLFPNASLIKIVNGVDYVDHYWINNILFLDPYHPGYTAYGKIDRVIYINDIIRTVREIYKPHLPAL